MGILRVQTLILLVIALGLAEFLAYEQCPQAGTRKIAVTVARSKTETVTHHYKCTSYGQFYSEIRAPAGGYLAEVSVKEGQTVKKGDPLFKIRPPEDEEKSRAVDGDQAASSEAGHAVIGSDLLFRLPPPEDVEKPKADNPNRVISIRAASGGLIGRLTHRPGRIVRKDDLLTTVVRTSVIEARFKVPEKEYLESAIEWSRSQQSRRITLTLADQSKFPHAVESCQALAGGGEDGDIHFSAMFPNPDGLLRSGRSGTVSVSREWKDAIFLPRQATFWDRDRQYVFVVDKGHVAHRRAIVIGDGTENLLVVKEGVGVGDRIVVDGVGQVHDGDNVD
jgi:membrane fusion protein, multidrug efflux system